MASNEIEQALDAYDRATCEWNAAKLKDGTTTKEVGLARALAAAENFQATRAALIALLARDDARIARLEEIANEARAVNIQEVFRGGGWHKEARYPSLTKALDALDDADAPGGG